MRPYGKGGGGDVKVRYGGRWGGGGGRKVTKYIYDDEPHHLTLNGSLSRTLSQQDWSTHKADETQYTNIIPLGWRGNGWGWVGRKGGRGEEADPVAGETLT